MVYLKSRQNCSAETKWSFRVAFGAAPGTGGQTAVEKAECGIMWKKPGTECCGKVWEKSRRTVVKKLVAADGRKEYYIEKNKFRGGS